MLARIIVMFAHPCLTPAVRAGHLYVGPMIMSLLTLLAAGPVGNQAAVSILVLAASAPAGGVRGNAAPSGGPSRAGGHANSGCTIAVIGRTPRTTSRAMPGWG